jgi:hypothetical protein
LFNRVFFTRTGNRFARKHASPMSAAKNENAGAAGSGPAFQAIGGDLRCGREAISRWGIRGRQATDCTQGSRHRADLQSYGFREIASRSAETTAAKITDRHRFFAGKEYEIPLRLSGFRINPADT